MHHSVATVGTLAVVAGLAFVGGRLSTTYQGATAAASEQPAVGEPLSVEHQRLHAMLGDWEGTVRIKMMGEWSEWDTDIEREKAMDGMFVIEHIEATSNGMTYKGMGIIGYDPKEKKYQNVWIENMSPAVMMSDGTFDESTNVWTFTGEVPDPMTGKMVKTVTTVDTSDPDKEILAGYIIQPDGSKDKNFEATLERD